MRVAHIILSGAFSRLKAWNWSWRSTNVSSESAIPTCGRAVSRALASILAAVVVLTPIDIWGQAQRAGDVYKPPRTSDGAPDLQGVWQALNTAAWDIQDHGGSLGVPPGQGVVEGNEIPYQPWALAKRKENFTNRTTADPESKCQMAGVPRITYMQFPFQIVQTRDQVTMLYEYVHTIRNIYIGSQHPKGSLEWWMGDSRGHWEGNTLVVDVIGFTDQTWFDKAGHFHSDALHVIEHYTRTAPDRVDYQVTIEDPKVFTKPWRMAMPLYRRVEPNVQLLEYECYTYLIEDEAKKTK